MLLKELVVSIVSAEDFKISIVMAIYKRVKNHNSTTTMILDVMIQHSTRRGPISLFFIRTLDI
jgi:hypothetical protein